MSRALRRLLLAAAVVVALAFSGCLTLGPTVSADTGNSTVFESVSATESWSGPGVRVNATLESTPQAQNVTTLTVIKQNGRAYETVSVDPGQTTVVFTVPAGESATIVASNSVNSTTIEELNVSAGGNRLF